MKSFLQFTYSWFPQLIILWLLLLLVGASCTTLSGSNTSATVTLAAATVPQQIATSTINPTLTPTRKLVTEVVTSSPSPTSTPIVKATPSLTSTVAIAPTDTSFPIDTEIWNEVISETKEEYLSKLVFTSYNQSDDYNDTNINISVINEDDINHLLTLERSYPFTNPVWSPDCRQIAFVQNFSYDDRTNTVIGIVDVDDGSVQTLEDIPKPHYFPTWSPDGLQIAFTALVDYTSFSVIYLVELETRDVKLIGDDNDRISRLDWSPNGGQIAYSDLETSTIYKIGIEDENATSLLEVPIGSGSFEEPILNDASFPEWSPDGSKIAFTVIEDSYDREASKIYIVNENGSGLRQLVEGNRQNDLPESDDFYWLWQHNPKWSPDGQDILFSQVNTFTDEKELCLANVESGATDCWSVGTDEEIFYEFDWCYILKD